MMCLHRYISRKTIAGISIGKITMGPYRQICVGNFSDEWINVFQSCVDYFTSYMRVMYV